MKRKRKPVAVEKYEGPVFPPGSTCLILRPNLWSQCECVVVSEVNGIHHVRIPAKNGAAFHADIRGTELEIAI
jgi:hypothetical protein